MDKSKRNFLKRAIAIGVAMALPPIAFSNPKPIHPILSGKIGRYEGMRIIESPEENGGYMMTDDLHQQLTQAIAETSNKHVLAALKGAIYVA